METANTSSGDEHRPGVGYTVVRHIFRTMVYTPVYAISFGVICAAFTAYALANPGTEIGTFILLVILGWSIYAGQLEALDSLDDKEGRSRALPEKIIVGAFTLLYYNAMVLLSVVFALVVNTAGYPALAVASVILLPTADIWLGRQFNAGIAYSTLTLAEWIGGSLMDAYERVPAEEVAYAIVSLVSSVKDVLPPVTDHLVLTSISGRRLKKN